MCSTGSVHRKTCFVGFGYRRGCVWGKVILVLLVGTSYPFDGFWVPMRLFFGGRGTRRAVDLLFFVLRFLSCERD